MHVVSPGAPKSEQVILGIRQDSCQLIVDYKNLHTMFYFASKLEVGDFQALAKVNLVAVKLVFQVEGEINRFVEKSFIGTIYN